MLAATCLAIRPYLSLRRRSQILMKIIHGYDISIVVDANRSTIVEV
jgi:hypothetical protein